MSRQRTNRSRFWLLVASIGVGALIVAGAATASAKGAGKTKKGHHDAATLAKKLKVDEATAALLIVKKESHHETMRELHDNLFKIHEALRVALEEEGPDEAKIEKLLTALDMNEKAMAAERALFKESLPELLTPSQRARMALAHAGKGHGKMHGKGHGKMHGKDHGKMHGKDHGKMHGEDHGKMHGKDHGKMHGKDHGEGGHHAK